MNPRYPGDDAGAESGDDRAGSEGRYRHLVESAHDWVWEVDADARYIYSSPRVFDILGYQPDEVIGRTPFDLMPRAEADRVRGVFETIAAARRPFSRLENVNCHRNGSLVVLETNGVPILDAAGRLAGYRGWDRDVTERRQADRTVRESEERYRLMFESNPLPMWVFDIDTLRVLAVNEEATRRYGYTADEFLTMTLLDLRPPEEVPALIDMTRDLDVASPSQADLVRHRRRDGTVMDVEVTGHGIRFEGRRARLVVVRDVTERLALERQLRQAQKMDAVGRLAGGIAHDFNNLLTAILGYSDLLLAGQGTADGAEELREIKAAAERASRLTRQLLSFSRKEVSRREHVDLASLLDRMGSMLRRLLPENIALRVVAESPGLVTADPGQIEQVVLNLVVNSRDAMPDGGTIAIRLAERGRTVELAVEDTGVGMDEKTIERIFEPFFTTKSPDRGTGLGLSTVYGIVKQHAGDVQVRSVPGAGSTFTVSLPREAGGAHP
jgi:two-component system, cell cycle sensor histidine kinase and response regulator CckA